MGLHRNARLGLAGRRALVADVESGCSCREAARRRGVSPTTACKWWRRWSEATSEQRRSLACLEDRSSRPHRCPRLLPAAEQAADLRGQAPHGLGAAADRRRDRSSARDRLADAAAGGDLAAAPAATRAAAPVRVALPRRPAAHRHQAVCPLQPARPRRHRRSPPHRRREADAGRLRVGALASSTTTPATPTASSTATSARPQSPALSNAASPPSPLTGSRPKRLISDNAWTTPATARSRELLADARHPSPADPTPPPPGQRQGRALPADPQTRMGARPDLPLQRPPRPGTVTLAQLLQRAQTTQLTRRPATHQPRPQRPEAGHLGAGSRQRHPPELQAIARSRRHAFARVAACGLTPERSVGGTTFAGRRSGKCPDNSGGHHGTVSLASTVAGTPATRDDS